jgi:hypothetical protein
VTREAARPPGWYDDEADAALLRYWDGHRWSPHTAPKAAPRPDDVAGHTLRLRAPDEHTTVPLPPAHEADGASRRWLVRAVERARRSVGGHR